RRIRAAAPDFRLRYSTISVERVAFAGQRAELLLGIGSRRRAGKPQLYGRAQQGGRRHDRRAARGGKSRGFHLRGAGARSRTDVRPVPRTAVSSARAMGGTMGLYRAAVHDVAVRLSAGDLVASAANAMRQGCELF